MVARGDRHGRFRRVPRVVASSRRRRRRAIRLAEPPCIRPPRRGNVDRLRMAAGLCAYRLSMARGRLRVAAWFNARRLCADRRRLPGLARDGSMCRAGRRARRSAGRQRTGSGSRVRRDRGRAIRRRLVTATDRLDRSAGRSARRVAGARRRRAGTEVRRDVSRAHVRAVCRTGRAQQGPARCSARERVPDVRGRDSRGRAAESRGGGTLARWGRADRDVHRGAAAARLPGPSLLQHRRRAWNGRDPALSQASPRAVRRDDSAEGGRRLVHSQRPCDSARRPDAGRGEPAAAPGRGPPRGDEHLLRGRVRHAVPTS